MPVFQHHLVPLDWFDFAKLGALQPECMVFQHLDTEMRKELDLMLVYAWMIWRYQDDLFSTQRFERRDYSIGGIGRRYSGQIGDLFADFPPHFRAEHRGGGAMKQDSLRPCIRQ